MNSLSKYQPLNIRLLAKSNPYLGRKSPILSPSPRYNVDASPSATPTKLITTFAFHKAYKVTFSVGTNSLPTAFVQASS